VNFDLEALLQSAVPGTATPFPGPASSSTRRPDACFMRGAPDLIVQMLDKLIENAVDFCSASGTITVRLTRAGSSLRARREQRRAADPERDMLESLFESLFEHRSASTASRISA
jgi:two-component system sensor histidine kinase ChvG